MTGVANGVVVAVAGNQITVAVAVEVGCGVSVGSGGSGVDDGRQPARGITKIARRIDLTLSPSSVISGSQIPRDCVDHTGVNLQPATLNLHP